ASFTPLMSGLALHRLASLLDVVSKPRGYTEPKQSCFLAIDRVAMRDGARQEDEPVGLPLEGLPIAVECHGAREREEELVLFVNVWLWLLPRSSGDLPDRQQPAGLRGCCLDRRSEEHTSELQSRVDLVCRLLLEKKKETAKKREDAVGAPVAPVVGHGLHPARHPHLDGCRCRRQQRTCTLAPHHNCQLDHTPPPT